MPCGRSVREAFNLHLPRDVTREGPHDRFGLPLAEVNRPKGSVFQCGPAPGADHVCGLTRRGSDGMRERVSDYGSRITTPCGNHLLIRLTLILLNATVACVHRWCLSNVPCKRHQTRKRTNRRNLSRHPTPADVNDFTSDGFHCDRSVPSR